MTENRVLAPLLGGLGLLERSINYTLGSLQLVRRPTLAKATPCAGWDLHALLQHMDDSLKALHEAADHGDVKLASAGFYGDPWNDPVSTLRNRACSMLGAWTNAPNRDWVAVGGVPMTGGLFTVAGALEITVHGWDVAQACGQDRPIPDDLADELLPLAEVLVTGPDRRDRFAAPVPVSALTGPGDRLVGYLGRRPLTG